MNIEQFKRDFKHLNHVTFDGVILFRDFEVYDIAAESSCYYKTLEEALQHMHKGKTIAEYIEEMEKIEFHLDGGRGASSGEGGSLFGGQGGNDHRNNSTPDLPARMNKMYNGNKMSAGHTVGTFRKEHATSSKEHAIMYDDDGFVSTYIHGNDGSVGFSPSQVKGKHMIHNHPSDGWANFSKADLDSFSSTGMKSLAATSSKKTYTITKGKNFDAKGFQKAVAKARTTEKNYDKAVDKFLKQNAKKYGYTYNSESH